MQGAEIKANLFERRMHQYELAAIVGMSETELSRVVNGRKRPSPEQEIQIAVALGMRVEVRDAVPV